MKDHAETSEGNEAPAPVSGGTPQDVLPLVYEQLRALARRQLAAEKPGHTLQPTALVHEAYLRLAGDSQQFGSRSHFYAAAAQAMRRILIEHARSKKRVKRGGAMQRQWLNVLDLAALPESEQILAFDEAIDRLEKEIPLSASVVRLRFYAGLSVEETAESLGISARTVNREWAYARAWLYRALENEL